MIPKDFPTNGVEFDMRFSDEKACEEYLLNLKWPNGFSCPKCHHQKGWYIESRKIYQCESCNFQSSLTSGTVMDKTRKPLVLWFKAIYLMMSGSVGVNANYLKTQLGLSYPTAWTWLQKLRVATSHSSCDGLSGDIEIDESYVGGYEKGMQGRSKGEKSIVAGAVEYKEMSVGKVSLQVIPDASSDSLEDFAMNAIDTHSHVKTDGWRSYRRFSELGFDHEPCVAGSPKNAAKVLPYIHLVFSQLKRVILGTYQGCVSKKHIQKYLDEFSFRFNIRKTLNPAKKFHALMELSVKKRALPYWKIIGRVSPFQPLHLVVT